MRCGFDRSRFANLRPANMIDRRHFLKNATAAALGSSVAAASSAWSYRQILGANDRVRFAVAGVNNRGAAHMTAIASLAGTSLDYLIDVDSEVLRRRIDEYAAAGHRSPKGAGDYRRVLDDKSVDAITIAVPDHWHARLAVDALRAGKHVYVEKPVSAYAQEGEVLMAVAAALPRQVVQYGAQRRSSQVLTEFVELARSGVLGNIYQADTWYADARKSIGNGADTNVPAHLDWDLWQGPAPRTHYRSNVVHYNWHWFWRWGTGELPNNGMHELDVARWVMGVTFPERVAVSGQRRFYRGDDWEMYDTLLAEFTFPAGQIIRWTGHSCNMVPQYGRSRGVMVMGEKGCALLDSDSYEIFDLEGKSVRGAGGGAAIATDHRGGGNLDNAHFTNFVALIRGRSSVPVAPIREGHISTSYCQLGNIAYRSGLTLHCDPVTGRPSEAAAMQLWSREYAPGWDFTA